jgi:limonene 1,2-monooxygenase
MLTIPPDKQRDRMEEALEIILRLFDGETVTHESEWISLRNARLHLLPYTQPRPHVVIASAVTPNGAYVAGKFGLGMLCVAASNVAGYDVLDVNWGVADKSAAEHGNAMDRRDLRLVIHMHLAETREQAIEDVRWGFPKWQEYTLGVNPRGRLGTGSLEEVLAKGMTVVGTPDDAVEFLERYWTKTGGFGCLLLQATNWARFDATKRSYELFMRYALPKFSGINRAREESYAWMRSNTEEFSGAVMSASKKAFEKRFGTAADGSPALPNVTAKRR